MDQELKIKTYTPASSSYAPRISNEQWNQHKSLLKYLHDQGYKRAAMLGILREHNFNPSMGQLNAKMTVWGFKVYGTQSDSHEQDLDTSQEMLSLETPGTNAATVIGDDPAPRPTSRRSMSSLTLYESELPWTTQHDDTDFTLDQVIVFQTLALIGSYQPTVKPADLGFKVPPTGPVDDDVDCQPIIAVAEFLSAVHCFEQAFDLYHYAFEHLVTRSLTNDHSLVQGLIQCTTAATTVHQCAYAIQIARRAYSYCIGHAMVELASCFESIVKDLDDQEHLGDDMAKPSQSLGNNDLPLLMAINPRMESFAHGRDLLRQQLLACDSSCATLAHLSSWCQDTLSFFRLQNHVIGRFSPLSGGDISENLIAFELDFQVFVRALVIDYLNSPGPSMKGANRECKDSECSFRSTFSPSTSLIVMAHLLYEPLRLQSQPTTNRYLHTRAQNFAVSQTTTVVQELKAFASMEANVRCATFVDLFMKHFNTRLAFRRVVSSVNCSWDRLAAAKRLTQLLLSTQSGLVPHAGLPSSRRSILKTMASPFGHDPSLTEARPSVVSDSGSMGEFERFAAQIHLMDPSSGALTPSDAMSIDTRSSWSFHHVTGFSHGQLSARNSISSRRGEPDSTEEYRQFMRDNRTLHQDDSIYPDTPTPRQFRSPKGP